MSYARPSDISAAAFDGSIFDGSIFDRTIFDRTMRRGAGHFQHHIHASLELQK